MANDFLADVVEKSIDMAKLRKGGDPLKSTDQFKPTEVDAQDAKFVLGKKIRYFWFIERIEKYWKIGVPYRNEDIRGNPRKHFPDPNPNHVHRLNAIKKGSSPLDKKNFIKKPENKWFQSDW